MRVVPTSSVRPRNSLGTLAVLCAIAGTLSTGILYQRPDSPLLGRYGFEIGYGGPLREDLILLSALLGAVAILTALLSSIGGRTKPSAAGSVLLGAVALTFPVLVWLEVIGTPTRVPLFPT